MSYDYADTEHDAKEIAELRRQLNRANGLIAWMMPYIGRMCPPQNGLFDLNLHCFENHVRMNESDETRGRPIDQRDPPQSSAVARTAGDGK